MEVEARGQKHGASIDGWLPLTSNEPNPPLIMHEPPDVTGSLPRTPELRCWGRGEHDSCTGGIPKIALGWCVDRTCGEMTERRRFRSCNVTLPLAS